MPNRVSSTSEVSQKFSSRSNMQYTHIFIITAYHEFPGDVFNKGNKCLLHSPPVQFHNSICNT